MSPLRIALVAEDYYPQLGGVPEHVHHLARELDSLGHHTTIVTSNMRRQGVGEPVEHSDVRRIGTSLVIYANGGVARVTVGLRLTARFEALFRKERFDVVHVHGGLNPTLGLVAPRAAWRAGIPVVATFHTWFARSIGLRLLRGPFQRMLDRHAATIAVSGAARDAMARYFTAPWEIIPNGVDTTFFRPGLGRGSDGPRLLWLGRIEPRNDLGTVLAAMPRGTPLVVSDIPAFRDLAAQAQAVFVPVGDPDAWGAAVNALIDDTERRETMAREGRRVAERHAWPLVAQRVLAVYRRVT